MNTLYIKNWPEIKAIANLYGHYAKKDADFLCPWASNLPRFLTDIISRQATSNLDVRTVYFLQAWLLGKLLAVRLQ